MTDNKRVTNKQILDKIDALKVGEEGLNLLAIILLETYFKIPYDKEFKKLKKKKNEHKNTN